MNVSLPVNVTDFEPGSRWAHLNGLDDQVFSWGYILRSALVAGYPDLDRIPSLQFARWREAGLRLALRPIRGQLLQPPEWRNLDPSEKAALSSLLGIVVTKLLVERFLGASLFLFLDVHFDLTYPPDGPYIRPDFVAMSPNEEWFSVEAKGRQRFSPKGLRHGKDQTKSLGTVNGMPVQARVVCMTSFTGRRLKARFADPEPDSEELTKLRIEPIDALRLYYGRLNRFREFSEPMGERLDPNSNLNVHFYRLEALDVEFGILPDLEEAVKEGSADTALGILRQLSNPHLAENHPHLGPDGILVIPGESWNADNLQN